jgi:hypothetical protein
MNKLFVTEAVATNGRQCQLGTNCFMRSSDRRKNRTAVVELQVPSLIVILTFSQVETRFSSVGSPHLSSRVWIGRRNHEKNETFSVNGPSAI